MSPIRWITAANGAPVSDRFKAKKSCVAVKWLSFTACSFLAGATLPEKRAFRLEEKDVGVNQSGLKRFSQSFQFACDVDASGKAQLLAIARKFSKPKEIVFIVLSEFSHFL